MTLGRVAVVLDVFADGTWHITTLGGSKDGVEIIGVVVDTLKRSVHVIASSSDQRCSIIGV